MVPVNKVKVGDISYDISPSKDGILKGYTSNDNASPAAWSDVSEVSSEDTNSTIFSKLTSMARNVRWLYSKLGTTDISNIGDGTVTGGLNEIYNGLDNKSPVSHTHTVKDLPVTNDTYANSTTLIPSSAAVYSLKTLMSELSTEIAELEELTAIPTDDPNTRYESKDLGTWSSTSDVDTFMSQYNHDSNYSHGGVLLSLGNYVTIQEGAYNKQWVIAGFDMEHNQTAADGTVYDNGYGICMIPKTKLTTAKWNTRNTTNGGYKSSYMHNTVLPGIVNELKKVLGTHVVNRNVLLSSSVRNGSSTAYTWTTADATLMSGAQLTGTFASNSNKYDDGEANYKLPLFNYEDFWITNSNFWIRGLGAMYGSGAGLAAYNPNFGAGMIGYGSASTADWVRPLIYLR